MLAIVSLGHQIVSFAQNLTKEGSQALPSVITTQTTTKDNLLLLFFSKVEIFLSSLLVKNIMNIIGIL